MTRLFDIILSLIGIIILSPLFIVLGFWIIVDSKGPIFYRQVRIGRYGKEFFLLKFRSMHVDADKKGLLTVGGRDPRITKSGYYLRKFKLDELPQLFNVLSGEMSVVGPRPEVKKYVDLYTDEQRKVLNVRPGITDIASIEFSNENEILEQQDNPEQYYIDHIMPEKLRLNLRYILSPTIGNYLLIIFLTAKKIVTSK
ncbi:MAG: sugar transferase [Flavipsychrobacter sp.]